MSARGAGSSGLVARPADRCHADLYEDAFARQQRSHDMRRHQSERQRLEDEQHKMDFECTLKNSRKSYQMKDQRSHDEREQDFLKKRQQAKLTTQEAKERDELLACTFRPCLEKSGKRIERSDRGVGDSSRSGAAVPERARSPQTMRPSAQPYSVSSCEDGEKAFHARIRQLHERQIVASATFQALSLEDAHLRERLRVIHASLHERLRREETQRVVSCLAGGESGNPPGSIQNELLARVQRMVDQGHDAEVAQRRIVAELADNSHDEVRRRVVETFAPIRLEAEGELYARKLALVHELEFAEANAASLGGGAMLEEFKKIGFAFGLADQSRRALLASPGTPRQSPRILSRPISHQSSRGGSLTLAPGPPVGQNFEADPLRSLLNSSTVLLEPSHLSSPSGSLNASCTALPVPRTAAAAASASSVEEPTLPAAQQRALTPRSRCVSDADLREALSPVPMRKFLDDLTTAAVDPRTSAPSPVQSPVQVPPAETAAHEAPPQEPPDRTTLPSPPKRAPGAKARGPSKGKQGALVIGGSKAKNSFSLSTVASRLASTGGT